MKYDKNFEELCRKYKVSEMFIFGSAIRSDFDPEKSDIDIMVSFRKMTPAEHADSYFGLLEELEKYFGCNIDLLEKEAVKNPYLKKNIDESGVMVYASA
ncbi:nucleotidyltransferase family protein [Methanolacinia petrolearia]|uniref:nucleotidyltransferase family protein n=1 Tax=Methanolacinia petrolearia TaxID=54120 RepID=UPI001CDAEAD3|nr:nucleotidyltransferase domain-containing protein [Methanolacinia petrolearia]